jgi:hypothetical protein
MMALPVGPVAGNVVWDAPVISLKTRSAAPIQTRSQFPETWMWTNISRFRANLF